MFVTLIFVPLIITIAGFRMYKVALKLYLGELRFNQERGVFRPIRAVIAYVALMLYTAWMIVIVFEVLGMIFFEKTAGTAVPHSFFYALAYPIAYVLAEWTFYYGFQAVNRRGAD